MPTSLEYDLLVDELRISTGANCGLRSSLHEWAGHAPGVHAVLARTNAELSPYAAVALEMGLPYRAAEDGLLLDDSRLDVLLNQDAPDPPCLALARRAGRDPLARSLVAWATTTETAARFIGSPLSAEHRARLSDLRKRERMVKRSITRLKGQR